jgi:aminoglycoside 6-adenylyltransferase
LRNETEVLNQLINYAKSNNRVRAVLLNGSRVNPNVKHDIFCDYDVIFAVTEPIYFLQERDWIQKFGDLIILQQNTINDHNEEGYIFLMLFTDGIRIDLSFRDATSINNYIDDSLTKVLLDKDNLIKELDSPNDSSYFTRKPDQSEFDGVMNNIWWCSTNVAKGLWREELPYAKYMFDVVVRDCMVKMLAWYVGINHDWCINTGKVGRWLKDYLPAEIWEEFASTYAGADYSEIWDALIRAGRLTRKVGIELADKLGYEYPLEEDRNVMEYLNKIRFLPKDATEVIS